MTFVTPALFICLPLIAQEPPQPKPVAPMTLEKGIVGKWESTKLPVENVTMVFDLGSTKPGAMTWTIRSPGEELILQGTYKVKDDKTVVLETEKYLAGKNKFEQKVIIQGDMMTMTDPDGTSAEFKRLKKTD